MQVPIVDISGLYSESFEDRKAVSKEIGAAIDEVGFLYIKGHRTPDKTIADLKIAAKEFFTLGYDEKMEYYIGKSKNAKGFIPEGEEVYDTSRPADRKECIAFSLEVPDSHPYVLKGIPFYGNNVWPEIANFRARVLAYYSEMRDLAQLLVRACALVLDLEETELDQYFQDPLGTLRMLHFPYQPELEEAQGISEHEDFECLTILYNDAPGLELYGGDDEWTDVPPVPGTFIVNIGDMFELLTNGRFKPKAHRVRAVKEERYSFPFFYGCNYFTKMRPLPQFMNADEDTPSSQAVMGDHVWSAISQSYRYLADQIRTGEVDLPEGTKLRGAFIDSRMGTPEATAT